MNKIKRLLFSKWFLLFFNTVVFVLLAWLLPIHFETNDDVTMCMIANGSYSGIPDCHLVFINALYGWTIAGLYKLTNAVEWYTLSFCVLHVIAVTCIEYNILKMSCHPLVKIAFLVFLYVFWVRIISAFQFTTTAGLLCFGGCLAILKPTNKWRVVGIFAILIASLIRFNAAAMVALLCVPLFLNSILENRCCVYWYGAALLIVLVVRFSDRLFYQDEDWAYYWEYNELRGGINDNPFGELEENDLPDGVSMLDYDLLRNFVGDPQVMTLKKLEKLRDQINNNIKFELVLDNISQLSLFKFPIMFVCIGLLFGLIGLNGKSSWLPMLSLFVFSTVVLYLGCFKSFKYRVFLCVLLPMMYQLVYYASNINDSIPRVKKGLRNSKLRGIVSIVIAFVLFLCSAKYIKQDYQWVRHVREWKNEVFDTKQRPLVGNDRLIFSCKDYTPEYFSPFDLAHIPIRHVGLGWLTAIPFNEGVLESHLDFVDSDILLFCKAGHPPKELVESIHQNYGILVNMVLIDGNDEYALYQLKSSLK